jgi:hypothetical protein
MSPTERRRRRERHFDRLLGVVHAKLARTRLVFEPFAVSQGKIGLANRFHQPARA